MDASSGSRAKGPAAGGVKSANSLRGRGAGRGPPLTIVQDVAIDGHVLSRRSQAMSGPIRVVAIAARWSFSWACRYRAPRLAKGNLGHLTKRRVAMS
jgi:hypothetical protein